MGAETKDLLIDAAIRAIDQQGEAGLRIREVSEEVGVAYTSVYHFFGSRDGLVEAAQFERYRRDLAEPLDRFRSLVATTTTKEEFRHAIRTMLNWVFTQERAPRRLDRISALGSALGRPDLAQRFATLHDEHITDLAEVMRQPQQQGWVRADLDLRMVAAWYMGLVLGRTVIEFGGERDEHAAWNDIAANAILSTLLTPDD